MCHEKNQIIGFLSIHYTQFPRCVIVCKCCCVDYVISGDKDGYRLEAITGGKRTINTIHISILGLFRHINDITMSVIDELALKDIDCQNL